MGEKMSLHGGLLSNPPMLMSFALGLLPLVLCNVVEKGQHEEEGAFVESLINTFQLRIK